MVSVLIKVELGKFCPGWDLNPWPVDWKSSTLTTTPCKPEACKLNPHVSWSVPRNWTQDLQRINQQPMQHNPSHALTPGTGRRLEWWSWIVVHRRVESPAWWSRAGLGNRRSWSGRSASVPHSAAKIGWTTATTHPHPTDNRCCCFPRYLFRSLERQFINIINIRYYKSSPPHEQSAAIVSNLLLCVCNYLN